MTKRRYVETSAGQVHLREAGAGEPLVLLHQTPSSSMMYERCLALLAPARRVVALDTPGFGMSDSPPAAPASIDFYGDVVVEVMEELGLARAAVGGFHTGASIALDIATRHPDRVTGVVLAGLLVSRSDDERARWHQLVRRDWEPDPDGSFVEPLLAWAKMLSEGDGETVRAELTSALQAGPNYWWAYNAIIEFDAVRALRTLGCPTLFLNAVDDGPILETTSFAAGLVSHSFYAELPHASGTVTRSPESFAVAVTSFLEQL